MESFPSHPKNHTIFYVLLSLGFFCLLTFVFIIYSIQKTFSRGNSDFFAGDNEIDLIEIQGPIYESDDIVRRIKKFKNSTKNALLIRLDSPGGAVAPSQEIYTEILRAREKKKIVVASMSSLAASGAYYIASACDKIVANPGTLTGSIGVIAEFPDVSTLLKKVGVNFETIKSGKFKDTGSFSRPMTPEERQYLQTTINEVYEQFLRSVVNGRRTAFQEKLSKVLNKKASSITDAEIIHFIQPYADGRVLTGSRAFELGFVDQLGNYYDAVKLTADLSGIKGEPTVRQDVPSKLDQWVNGLLPFSFFSRNSTGFQLEYRAF
jgi:protease-4